MSDILELICSNCSFSSAIESPRCRVFKNQLVLKHTSVSITRIIVALNYKKSILISVAFAKERNGLLYEEVNLSSENAKKCRHSCLRALMNLELGCLATWSKKVRYQRSKAFLPWKNFGPCMDVEMYTNCQEITPLHVTHYWLIQNLTTEEKKDVWCPD